MSTGAADCSLRVRYEVTFMSMYETKITVDSDVHAELFRRKRTGNESFNDVCRRVLELGEQRRPTAEAEVEIES